MPTSGTVWAFDLGKGSIGEAVRSGNEFLHKASLLIPAEFAETKTAAKRRRAWRTRIAHRERECWLEKVWAVAGLPVLYGRNRDQKTGEWKAGEKADQRLEQEFAKPGDDTCYTSCLLRIKLLHGDADLKDWQILKALRSAIQKRGYAKVPWAAREERRSGKTEEQADAELAKKDPAYREAIEAWGKFKQRVPEAFHYPCYYDAERMRLWDSVQPEKLRSRTTHDAESTRRIRFDRADVEKEVKALAANAVNLLPPLAKAFTRIQGEGWDQTDQSGNKRHFPVRAESFGDFLCYGPAGKAHASYVPALRAQTGLHLGSNDDWMGALGQKIPRFDNRILDDCVLIPRYHVCKADLRQDKKTGRPFQETLLPAEVTFLMKLKNTLIADGTGQRKLKVDEVQKIFTTVSAKLAKVKPDAKDWAGKIAKCFALTKADWGRTRGIKELELRPLPGHEEVKPPKDSGRSGFSRPALRLLKELILAGKSPLEHHAEQLKRLNGNTDPTRGLVAGDLKFLCDMGKSWDDIHVPAQKLDALAARHTEDGRLDADKAVADLLGSVNDPVVRHRLGVFAERLRELRKKFGMPEEVVLEFVREDFMGPKRKMELLKFQREREASRKEARKMAEESGAAEKSAALKYELGKEQGFICLYCGQSLAATKLDQYEIEHIVPRSQGGPDAMVNYVLAHKECNEAKDEQTPFQWKHGRDGWDGYKQIVERHATTLRNKKVQLLLREDAPELVSRYTALAETAWISKLAQTIASLYFGWNNGNDSQGQKRVTIISGGLTARVRRKYRLNSVLNPCPAGEDPLLWEQKCEKNRDDDRHHALDAMVISFIPGWARNERKEHFFRFPEPIHKNAKGFFEQEINQVMPRAIAFGRATLAETIYGARPTKSGSVIVQRVPLRELAMKPIAPGKTKFDVDYLRKQIKAVRDANIVAALTHFADDNPDLAAWESFCDDFRLRRKDGQPGPRVLRVNVKVGEPDEFKEMSKDGTGAWRKGLGSHKGQIIYWDQNGELSVRPVFAHGSVASEQSFVERLGGKAKFYGFFQSDCAVRTAKEIPAEKYKLVIRNEAKQKRRIPAEKALPPCELTLRTIVTKSLDTELTTANNTRIAAKLDTWVEAGLTRIKK